jgi:hypothetical protein
VIAYDESEQLDVVPARHFVRVIKREKRSAVVARRARCVRDVVGDGGCPHYWRRAEP